MNPKRKRYDWAMVQQYYDEGHSLLATARHFGFQPGAWYKAVASGKVISRPFDNRRYDWRAIQRFYDEGHSYKECRERFGFSPKAWSDAIAAGKILARARRSSLNDLYSKARGRLTVKRVLLAHGVIENRCEICGIDSWLGKPLACHLDHINGLRDDHRIENLRMLCPNCHSQTPTYGGRNLRSNRQG